MTSDMVPLLVKADAGLMLYDTRGYKVFTNDSLGKSPCRIILEDWCEENCTGKYWISAGCGKFELKEDAVLFQLTWADNNGV